MNQRRNLVADMDIFRGQRAKNRGAAAKAGSIFIDSQLMKINVISNLTRTISQTKSALKTMNPRERSIALGILRAVNRREGVSLEGTIFENVALVLSPKLGQVDIFEFSKTVEKLKKLGLLKKSKIQIKKYSELKKDKQ